MYLSRLYIENYKSIKNLDLRLQRGKNIIVGRNNSGKSNILKAIDLVLGEYSPTYSKSENIQDNDFFCSETNRPIFIWCEIDREKQEEGLEKIDFSDVAKSAYYRLYADREYTKPFVVRTTDFRKEEKVKIFEYTTDKGQASIDNNEVCKRWIGGKSYCKGWTYEKEFYDKASFALAFLAYKPNDGKEIKKELVFLYRRTKEEDWIIGFNCNLRNILLQSAIIPAFRDPKDQLRINAYSWFGKLLKAYLEPDNEQLNNAFAAVRDASDEMFRNLKSKISAGEIDIAFPNTTISFQFNPDSKQDIHKSTLIYVNDGFNSELKDKGAGIQSAVTISLNKAKKHY